MKRILILTVIAVMIVIAVYKCSFDTSVDSYTNKRALKRHVKVELTEDIKNIYYYSNEIGFDATDMLAFNCNKQTINKIVKALQLKHQTKQLINSVNPIKIELSWWTAEETQGLDYYYLENEKRNVWYLWYDSVKQKAYLLTYDW